jgi:serpin B
MMKRIKVAAALLVCLCIIIPLAACASETQDNNRLSAKVAAVNAKELEAPIYGEQNSEVSAVANGANDFAFRLSAVLVENIGSENFVCSPYSVWLPLAALVSATDAQNKAALLSALGTSGITEADINRAASRMLYDLTKLRNEEYKEYYYNPLKVANAIFVGLDVTLKKDFAQTFMDYYRGSAINVDFTSRDAVDAVNQWASENTDGLITDLIQEFDPATVAAIANAIYFSDRWEWEFDPDQTTEDVFHAPAGDTTALYMLREGDAQTYYEDGRVQAMPLQFNTGGGMYIILPKTGNAAELLSSMTSEYFDEIQMNSISATGKLLLPRFSIENDIKGLKEALEILGVPLFDDISAPLTGGLIEENIPAWLSDAIQKAVIHVDEKGTTAAAVTVMTVDNSAMPQPTKPFEMNCNSPFVFILYEYTYDGGNQILFTGIVNQP